MLEKFNMTILSYQFFSALSYWYITYSDNDGLIFRAIFLFFPSLLFQLHEKYTKGVSLNIFF